MSFRASPGWKRKAAAIVMFGIAFGYVEAAVVTYLRPQLYAARAAVARPGTDLFPLLSLRQVEAAGPAMVRTTGTEIVREAATLVMLGAVAAAVAAGFRPWLAYFLLAFGVWDLFYYVFLKVLIDWPKSLLTWDILFLIPVPWTGPVIAPVLVALTMIVTGLEYLRREGNDAAPRILHWLGAGVGALVVLATFLWDYRHIMAGGMPNAFHWKLFALGEGIWITAFLHWRFAARPAHPSATKQQVAMPDSLLSGPARTEPATTVDAEEPMNG